MKQYVCLLIMVLLSAFTGNRLSAQQNVESDIKTIRELYQQAQEFVKHDKEDPTVEYQLTLSLRRHYTVEGHVVYDYNFYFGRDGLDGITGSPRLKFVRVKITDRGGVCNEEYLFNDKEDLVFYFTKFNDYENSKNVEIRLYYKDGERIRNLVKTTAHTSGKVADYTVIPEDYRGWKDIALQNTERTKSLFRTGMGIGYNESDITMDEAVDILSKKLKDQSMKYMLGEEYESQTVNGEKTHYIRAYHESSDGETIGTFGHFYIGRRSGEIYITDVIVGNDIVLYDDYLRKYDF